MADDGKLNGALQENILTLLVFDAQFGKMARAALAPQSFDSAIYREIAGVAIDFIDQFGSPVGDHLPDHLEHILKGEDARKAGAYKRIIDALFIAREGVNGEYVMSQLHKWVRHQNLKDAFVLAVEAFEGGNVDAAESALQAGLNKQVVAFNAGLNLSKTTDVSKLFTGELQQEGFPLGIAELDRHGIMPRRKELLLFVAPRKRGKSWFCTHVAKQAMIHRWQCAVVTLEMSEGQYGVRFVQSFLSVSREGGEIRVAKLEHNDGKLTDIFHESIDRMNLRNDKDTIATATRRGLTRRPAPIIKQFPTGSLTIEELEAWLDGLERFEGITIDCLIVDYPDLMSHNINNKRLELGRIIERLRGLGVARNMAIVAPSQGNKESESAANVNASMAAEDISKLATCDVALSYSQTKAEKALGLARISVDAARNHQDGFSVLITQAYPIGQFCLSSMMMGDTYSSMKAGVQSPMGQRDDDDDEGGESRGRFGSTGRRTPRR